MNPAVPLIPKDELQVDFVRSSGPGGQKVNKTSSKAQLRWHVASSRAFTPEQKARIYARAASRINAVGEIVISADVERSQSQNRADAVSRLNAIVRTALAPVKPRIKTKVGPAQRRKRLESKLIVSRKKALRRPPSAE